MQEVKSISLETLKQMSTRMYGDIVKADVDIANNLVVVDMEMHADGEAYLLAKGSKQNDLWGINLHPDKYGSDDFIEYDSMINIRPSQNNPSRDVLNEEVRGAIAQLISEVVHV
ncbi:MAG TPA: DUF5674 family protein [Candidatus Saccharimonadales bacterium]|nr:DUF5674 family protein [Candidatus Saccharimonadales bacterium]